MNVAAWLQDLGLARYEQAFRESDIDADVLPELTEADLEKLGVSLGHRKKLLKAIAALTAEPAATEPAAAVSPGEAKDAKPRKRSGATAADGDVL